MVMPLVPIVSSDSADRWTLSQL